MPGAANIIQLPGTPGIFLHLASTLLFKSIIEHEKNNSYTLRHTF